jgi:hypothetical protein
MPFRSILPVFALCVLTLAIAAPAPAEEQGCEGPVQARERTREQTQTQEQEQTGTQNQEQQQTQEENGTQSREQTRANWRVRTRVEAEGDSPVCAKVRLRSHEKKGAQLRLKVRGLEPDAECELRITDPDSGELLAVDECKADGNGRIRIRARSRDGDAVFSGEDNASGLAGARFELRYQWGETAIEGEIPAP